MRPCSLARSSPAFRLAAASLLLAGAALLTPRPAQAALSALDDAQLAQVNGRAAPPWQVPAHDRDRAATLPVASGLLGLFMPAQVQATVLDRAGFEAAWAARGFAALPESLYDGRPVTQWAVDAPPVNLQMEAGRFLLSTVGLDYQGPSFGTVTITRLDARGTTLWVWPH
jgi:hypothetical protein